MDSIIDKIPIDKFKETYLPYLQKNKKTVWSISAAITATLLVRYVYRKLTVPPKKLRAFPCVTYIDLIKTIMRGDTAYEEKRKLVLPLLNKANGLYLAPTHMGWQIRSTNPEVSKLLLSDIELFPKYEDMFGSGGSLGCRFIGGKHIGSLEGDEWRRHRKIVNPAFHRALPVNLFGQLSQKTFNIMEKIGLENLGVTAFCERMTLDAIGLAGFGFDFEAVTDLNSKWVEGYDKIRSNMTALFFLLFQVFDDQLKWMFPARVEAHHQLDILLERIDSMITEKRVLVTEKINSPDYASVPDAEKDLLTLMLEAELQGEGKLSDLELSRNIVGFFFAGHDTTSNALAFAIAQMGRNKEIQEKARAEVISVLGDKPENIIPTVEDTKKMKYLDAIIKETLRLNSPITNTLPRIASKDIVLDGLVIPKGTFVDIDIVSTHLKEDIWKDAGEFRPERFLEGGDATSTKEGLKWVPFGYGSHTCLGMNFSYAEQRVFLSMLLRKFDWELTEDSIHKNGVIAEGYGGVRPVDLRANFHKRY